MPGTIQVSILELVEIPSVQSSSMAIKVTVGKQAHEAQASGDFSFPLASFRDNLNVSIRDSEGTEVAHTAVETRSIVEKGIWDDLFSLKGGGYVRMRLQFVLTEDELKRIRSMREYATRKKQEDILRRRHSSSDLANASGGSASSQDSPRSADRAEKRYANPADNQISKISVGSANVLSKDHFSQKRETTPVFPISKSAGALDKLLVDRPIKKVIEPQDQEQQSPLDEAPSNVRKMVLAFETNPAKEVSPGISKTRSVPHISSTAMVEAPVTVPSVKRTTGANAKPAPISEGTEKEPGENQDYGTCIYEEQLVEKPEQPKDLKPQNIDDVSSEKDRPKVQPPREEHEEDLEVQNIDDMSSKKDTPKMQPTTKEQKEEKQHLELQNGNCMSSKMDITKMEPIREEQKDGQKDLDQKVQKINYMPSKKDALEMQLSKEKQKEERDLKLQNIDYISSKKDMPTMQTSGEEPKEEKKDMQKMQHTEEEQKEEKKDLKPQKIGYLSSKKGIPIVQPAREEQKEERRDLKLKNIDHMSSKKDLPKMQPIREEVKEDKKDLKLLNFDYMSATKDIPKIQPTRQEQKDEEKSPKKLDLLSAADDSRLSWGRLIQAFLSGNQSSTDMSTELQRSLCHEPFVIKKNWRSKHWKSLKHKVKSNMTHGNVNYTSDRFHEWIFLDEMICSCIRSDDKPFTDLLEGWLSSCSSGTIQGKLTDSDLAPDINEKTAGQRKSLDSVSSSSNNGNSRRPIGQAVKIAIMVGFGILVFLNRQRR